MYAQKYRPRVLEEVQGHAIEIARLRAWLGPYPSPKPTPRKPVCIIGPTGIGKTTIAHLLAVQAGYVVQEFNASDTRTPNVLKNNIASTNSRLQDVLIVIDEIDCMQDQGGISALTTIIKSTPTIPIVLISNERPQKIRTLLGHCIEIRLTSPPTYMIIEFLKKIIRKERLKIPTDILQSMCAGRDIRALLNNLEFYRKSEMQGKDNTYDIFSATYKIINDKTLTISQVESIIGSDSMMVPAMLEESYLHSNKTLQGALKASTYVCNGDVIQRRIQRKADWIALPYYTTTAACIARSMDGSAPTNMFPSWLGKNSTRRRRFRELGGLRLPNARLDYVGLIDVILGRETDEKKIVEKLVGTGITRDMYFEIIREMCFEPVPISTKLKTAITRVYKKATKNKRTPTIRHIKIDNIDDVEEDMEQ